jgi:hypothetical protein
LGAIADHLRIRRIANGKIAKLREDPAEPIVAKATSRDVRGATANLAAPCLTAGFPRVIEAAASCLHTSQ